MKNLTDEAKNDISLFHDRLEILYDQINCYIGSVNLGLFSERVVVDIAEEAYGVYEATKLVIKNKSNDKIAELMPIGIDIIGAEARVDLRGPQRSEILVYLSEGGPSILTKISLNDEEISKDKKSLYGYRSEGWHWVDDRVMGMMPDLTCEMFLKLLEKVN